MTDTPGGKEASKKTFGYIELLTKEARKAMTGEFNQKHKGAGFGKIPEILSQSTIDWFTKRDKNIRLTLESINEAKNGQVRMIFNGDSKSARFKMRLDATFSVSGQSPDSPAYLKDLNFAVDARDFY